MKKCCTIFIICCLFLLTEGSPSLHAANKNGVSPNHISVPSGPGTIEGLGDSFQPLLNTGMAHYSTRIKLPKGIKGHTPQLSLDYSSGDGDSPLGIGWSFGPGAISRQVDRGVPRYIDTLDRFLDANGEELAPLEDGSYRPRIEGSFVRCHRVGDHWEADLRDGSKQRYGVTPQARVTDASGQKVYRWLLESDTDPNGNTIEYRYSSFPGSDNQKYLTEIRYASEASGGQSFYFVSLTYEARPNWRKDYRSGFEIKTAHRLIQIDVGLQGTATPPLAAEGDWNNDTLPDALIRRYQLTYYSGGSEGFFLRNITQYGSSGVHYLPPITLSYTTFEPGASISATEGLLPSLNNPNQALDNAHVELVDLNRDGLPDILKTLNNQHEGFLNLGPQGEGTDQTLNWGGTSIVTSVNGQANSVELGDNRAHLADMNGDGLADLVQTDLSNNVTYYPNLGNLEWGELRTMSVEGTKPPAPFANTNAALMDVDFDKHIDVVRSDPTGYSIWFNRGNDQYSPQVVVTGPTYLGQVLLFSDPSVRRADINGDRLQDIIKITATRIVYAANQGHGDFAPAVEILIPDQSLTPEQEERAQLHDINADGLDDLVIERATANTIWYWLNLGTDQLSTRHTITDLPSDFSPTATTRWADINGNGTMDLIYADSTLALEDRLRIVDIGFIEQIPGAPNLLSVIDNGLGIQTNIIYRSSSRYFADARDEGEPWTSSTPFPVSLVFQTQVTTGMDVDATPGIDTYVDEYIYRDAFYDTEENAFRGFAKTSVINHGDASAPTLVTNHTFFNGGPDGIDNDQDGEIDEISSEGFHEEEALEGRTIEVETTNEAGDVVFSRKQYDWTIRNLPTSALGSAPVGQVEVRFPFDQEEVLWTIEGSATPKKQKASYVYDDFGNIIEEHNCGLVDPNTILTLHQCDDFGDDERLTNITVINDTTLWNLGKPTVKVTMGRLGNRVDETRSYYDGEAYVGLPLGQLTRGNLSRQERWVSGEGNEAQYIEVARNRFDTHGNLTATLDPNADRLNLGSGGHWREFVYDSVLNIFVTEERIHLGNDQPSLSFRADYHLGFGLPTQNFDFNDQLTTFHYDRFARLTKMVKPGDSDSFPTFEYIYVLSDPTHQMIYWYNVDGNLVIFQDPNIISSLVATRTREQFGQADYFLTIQHFDGLGRHLAHIEEAEFGGFIVHNAVRFNQRKTKQYHYLAYPAPTSTQYIPPPLPSSEEAPPFEEFHYDALGRRATQFHAATAENGVTQKSFHYDPLEVEQTDENGHIHRFFTDGLGRLSKVHEHNGQEVYVTTYDYNPLDRVLKITDAQNNQKTLAYDGLQRVVESNDPDRGRMQYVYDAASNTIRSTDNKSQVINFEYDGANRIISEDYLDGLGKSPDVAYHYDTPSTEDYPNTTNTRGRISFIEDLAGGQFFSYDARGNATMMVKRITHQGQSTDYRFTTTYDAMDREVTTTWPNHKSVSYIYNNRSLLESISGVVQDIDYEPSGKLTSCLYENGLEMRHRYDTRERLIGLETIDPSDPSDPIQHLSYFKDGFGNLLNITDGRTNLPPDSPKDATQQFQYDDLNRLTQSSGHYGQIDLSYDKIGNLTAKHSPPAPDPLHVAEPSINLGAIQYGSVLGSQGRTGRLPGEPPGPHAVTSTTSGLQYDYDDNGNLTAHAGINHTWDFKDRLVGIDHGNTEASYVYDAHNQRTIRTIDDGFQTQSIFYVSHNFEVRNGRALRYLFIGDQRIARIEDPSALPPPSILNFEAGWNFFSLPQEPNDPDIEAFLASLAGQFSQVLSFDPTTGEYQRYAPGVADNDFSELHAGVGYLIEMNISADFDIAGLVSESDAPTSLGLDAGWSLIPSPVAASASPEAALASIAEQSVALWGYDSASQQWQYVDLNDQTPDFLNDPEFTLEPNQSYWLQTNAATTLALPHSSTVFYHPDHLHSTNFLSDENGEVVATTEFYPYGKPRYQERQGDIENAYQYTGKELDEESELMYYESRYYQATPGRFASVDPLFETLGGGYGAKAYKHFLKSPQEGNLYAYAGNNPQLYNDPSGFGKKRVSVAKDPYQRPKWRVSIRPALEKRQRAGPGKIRCAGCGRVEPIKWLRRVGNRWVTNWEIDHWKATFRRLVQIAKDYNLIRKKFIDLNNNLKNLRLLCRTCNNGGDLEPSDAESDRFAQQMMDEMFPDLRGAPAEAGDVATAGAEDMAVGAEALGESATILEEAAAVSVEATGTIGAAGGAELLILAL